MVNIPKRPDRRVARTRQSLQEAFHHVAHEKGFVAMSVQDIAERANVNRGTFYAHYPDKYALYDTIVREEFRQLLAETLPPIAEWDRATLRLLIRTVLEYVEHRHRNCRLTETLGPLTERATHGELTRLLTAWLDDRHRPGALWRVPPTTIVQVLVGGIFGAAAQWASLETATLTADQKACDILTVLTAGLETLAPGALPE
jgi:AcrR family transcriptional regulator